MRSFATAALAGLVAATPMTDMEFKFINYVAKFGKSYATTEEYAFRLEQFAKVDQFIQETNAVEQNFTVGHNIFSDYTHAEYKKLLGYKPVQTTSTAEVSNAVPDFATGVNWVTAGAVTGVKDQGHCGSCWSFSSTGALEGAWFVKAGELLSFSEKQLVDCVKACFGCNGGNQTLAFHYYTSHFPMSEAIYPYQPVGGTCQYDVNNSYQNIQVTGAV